MTAALFLLLALLWPLLLMALLAYPGTRTLARRLAPWAALPALLLAFGGADSTAELPWAMLGGMLRLEFTGRVFLLLAASFSLVAGLLARETIGDCRGGNRLALFLLLAISGMLWLALTGDALLFFTAATVLGYALYAMLAQGTGAAAGRVFIVLLVVGDLVVFEVLLVLAHNAGGTAFSALRHALLLSDYPAATFFLVLIGFGIKLGLVGVHFWLAPTFIQAGASLRILLIGFVLCAGMLGWLRLLPLGEVQWLIAGTWLQWVALATLAYALAVGMLQADLRSLLAYVVMVLSALFLWLLGAVLIEPTLWPGLFRPLHSALLQAGYAFTLLYLYPGRIDVATTTWRHRGLSITWWLGVFLLVTTPLGLIASLAQIDPPLSERFTWLGMAFVLLPARSLWLQCSVPVTGDKPVVLAALSIAGLTAGASSLSAMSLGELWLPALFTLVATVVGWFGGKLANRLPTLPPGDLLGPVERGGTALISSLYRQLDRRMSNGFSGILQIQRRLAVAMAWRQKARLLEAVLGRWSVAMCLLVLFGLLLAWWGSFV